MIDRHRDESEIRHALYRYARAVDRGQWELLRSVFHGDAIDEHGAYNGGIDGLIAWLRERFADGRSTVHVIGQCLIEFAGPDVALVETYFSGTRPPKGAECRPGDADTRYVQTMGRYVDRFERRNGEWRIAHRRTAIDLRLLQELQCSHGTGASNWGRRDHTDPLFVGRAELMPDPEPPSSDR